MRTMLMASATAILLTGCVAHRPPGSHPVSYHPAHHAAHHVGRAIGHVLVTPAVIVAGLIEGIASLPYFLNADVHAMDDAMRHAKTRVTLGQTYQYAYNRDLASVPKSGNTGKVFQHVSGATRHFQNVLRGYGVKDYQRYFITAVRSADRQGYTLYALVYRPADEIRVRDRSGQVVTLGPQDVRRYYHPYDRDADGRALDSVIDWAGVPRRSIATQKGQAILLTLAANSVIINRRSEDFWHIRRRWIAGEYRKIARERKKMIDRRLGVKRGKRG